MFKSPTQTVQKYLDAMESRNLNAAEALLGTDFTITFPGNNIFSRLEEVVEWARPRYRHVSKIYERFDEAPTDGGVIVYCFGKLSGEWLDGTSFEGIRFIDRFMVKDGKLIDQQVWNDLAETKTQKGSS